MQRPRARLLLALALACPPAVAGWGCNGPGSPTIDPKAAVDKAAGGDGQARQSSKAKEASTEAATKHPKLH